jgi:hypothetical protein
MTMRMMAIVAAVMMLAMTAFSGTSAYAWSDVLEGRPDGLRDDAPAGYYIWHNEHGLHLYTTGGGPAHHFTGTLTTDGTFRGITLMRGEQVDSYTDDGGNSLAIDFTSWGHFDGVNFHIEGGTQVTFDLQMDGQPIPVEMINLGNAQWHPDSNLFTIAR